MYGLKRINFRATERVVSYSLRLKKNSPLIFSRSRLLSTPDQMVTANVLWTRASPKRLKRTLVPSKKKMWNLERQKCSIQPSKPKPANHRPALCERCPVLITSLISVFREETTSSITTPIRDTIHHRHTAKCNYTAELLSEDHHHHHHHIFIYPRILE